MELAAAESKNVKQQRKTLKVKRIKKPNAEKLSSRPQSAKFIVDPTAKQKAQKLNTTLRNNAKSATVKMANISFAKLTANPIPFLESQTTEQIAGLLRDSAYQYYKGTPTITDDIVKWYQAKVVTHYKERYPNWEEEVAGRFETSLLDGKS